MWCSRPTPPWSAQQDASKRAAQDVAERIHLDWGLVPAAQEMIVKSHEADRYVATRPRV
jgi:hypothetical protein